MVQIRDPEEVGAYRETAASLSGYGGATISGCDSLAAV
jgi:hypothetical protein